MAGAITTYPLPQDAAAWSLTNFGGVDLGDTRRDARLLRLVAAIAAAPNMTIPKQTATWGETKAAYRLLSNHDISPDAIQMPHRLLTRQLCSAHPIILCIEDTSEIDYTSRRDVKGLGKTGTGHGRGFEQHSTLAVLPNGDVLGLLDVHSCLKPDPPVGETRTQAAERWNMGDLWHGAAAAGGGLPKVDLLRTINRPAKPASEQTKALAAHYQQALRALGTDLEFTTSSGVCDGNNMQAAGLATIGSLGVRGGGLHTTTEWIELSSLVERCQALAVLLMRLVHP